LRQSLSFVLPLALYLASAYRDVMYWDTGEMDTVPYILGIAHAPGYPLYTLLGWAFSHLLPLGSVAWRMSCLSALAMSGAAWFVARITIDETGDESAGLAAALLFAAGGDAWAHATRAEPHAFVALAYAALLCYLLRWYRSGSARDLYVAASIFGLGVAVHPVVGCALPGILAAIVARAHETENVVLRRAAIVACASGAVWFAYLPLRSAYVNAERLDPAARYGVVGSAFWNNGDPAVAAHFLSLVTGEQVRINGTRLGYSAEEFDRGVVRFTELALTQWTIPGFVLAIAGAIVIFRRNVGRGIVAFSTCAPSALFACGFAAESDVDRYFLPMLILLAAAAGEAVGRVRGALPRRTILAASGLIVTYLILSQPHFFAQPHDRRAAIEGGEIVRATPVNSIVIATWVIAPVLAYDDYVMHATGDRVLIPAWYGDEDDRIPGWVALRPVFVAGTPEGSVPGYHLERVPTQTALYRVVRDR
jgi:4-amino-4-deoxy-L-arabinose transferase-like glycosyltransferase